MLLFYGYPSNLQRSFIVYAPAQRRICPYVNIGRIRLATMDRTSSPIITRDTIFTHLGLICSPPPSKFSLWPFPPYCGAASVRSTVHIRLPQGWAFFSSTRWFSFNSIVDSLLRRFAPKASTVKHHGAYDSLSKRIGWCVRCAEMNTYRRAPALSSRPSSPSPSSSAPWRSRRCWRAWPSDVTARGT